MTDNTPTYWLPSWWDFVEDWSDCRTCLEYNGSPCVSCEFPPGLLGLACLVGGGAAVVAGGIRGNQTIATDRQAAAAARVPGVSQAEVNVAVQKSQKERNQLRNALQNQTQHGTHR